MKKKAPSKLSPKKRELRQLQRWVSSRMALVIGRSGRGGSGVILQLKDGTFGILTARHVVTGAASTGSLGCVFCGIAGAQSFVPEAIRIHCSRDVAIVYLRPGQKPPAFVAYSEWSQYPPLPGPDELLVSSGAPGAWKASLDETSNTIELTKILHYYTRWVEHDHGTGRFRCEVDESDERLPRTFRGVSGGPVFTSKRELLGINVEEVQCPAGGVQALYGLPLRYAGALFDQATRLAGPMEDYVGVCESIAGSLRWKRDPDGAAFPFVVHAQYGVSQGNPDAEHGRIGVILKVEINGIPLGAGHRFTYTSGDLAQRMGKLQSEALFVVGAIDDFELA